MQQGLAPPQVLEEGIVNFVAQKDEGTQLLQGSECLSHHFRDESAVLKA